MHYEPTFIEVTANSHCSRWQCCWATLAQRQKFWKHTSLIYFVFCWGYYTGVGVLPPSCGYIFYFRLGKETFTVDPQSRVHDCYLPDTSLLLEFARKKNIMLGIPHTTILYLTERFFFTFMWKQLNMFDKSSGNSCWLHFVIDSECSDSSQPNVQAPPRSY